jgi:hypothetical protein
MEEVEVWRVRGVGSGEFGYRHNVAAQSVGQENPTVTDASREHRAPSSSTWSQINQLADTGATRAECAGSHCLSAC